MLFATIWVRAATTTTIPAVISNQTGSGWLWVGWWIVISRILCQRRRGSLHGHRLIDESTWGFYFRCCWATPFATFVGWFGTWKTIYICFEIFALSMETIWFARAAFARLLMVAWFDFVVHDFNVQYRFALFADMFVVNVSCSFGARRRELYKGVVWLFCAWASHTSWSAWKVAFMPSCFFMPMSAI